MALSNDSIEVTPGSGALVATQLVAGKEIQVMIPTDGTGHLQRTKATWVFSTGNTPHVAAARTTLVDLFNDVGSGVLLRVVGLYVIPTLAAVTGVGQTYEVIRTTTVGSGGTGVSGRGLDTAQVALPSEVSARLKPAGGAAGSDVTLFLNGSSEETNPYAALASQLNHIPQCADLGAQAGLVLREGQGVKVDQTTNSSIGSVNLVMVVTVE
jgi:hypothetical protein